MLTLSSIKPDYQLIRDQFQNYLSGKAAWTDILPTGTGQTLSDFVAAVGAQDQFAIEHAFREAFRTARLDSSIFAQAVLLGVRLSRKIPCKLTAVLQRSLKDAEQTFIIPAFTQFTCSSSLLFNREAIIMSVGDTQVSAELFEGQVVKHRLGSDGVAWQMFVSTEDKNSVSDQDVRVLLNGLPIEVIQRSLWHAREKSGVQDSTTPQGQLLLTFGNEMYGTQPQTNDIIDIMYAVTKGSAGQNANMPGRKITIVGLNNITGNAVSSLTGGGDEKKAIFYRKLYPQLFSAGERVATTEEEYAAVAASYPGVIDARVLGQRSLAPTDNRWMNLHQVTLLTETEWSGADWDRFIKWLQPRTMYPSRFVQKKPVPVNVNLAATIYCHGRSDLNAVEAAIRANVNALFQPRPGIIDSNIYRSDIYATIKNSSDSIEFITLDEPSTDITVGIRPPAKLICTPLTGGRLPAGTYTYAVTAVTVQGETLATNFTSATVNDLGAVSVVWTPEMNAYQYKIYGRRDVFGLLGTVNGSIGSFVDNGTITPKESLPILNSSGHFYPRLADLQLTMAFTNRNFYDVGELK